MSKSPRYTTFAPGELETRLKEIAPNARFVTAPPEAGHPRGATLLRAHRFPVSLPDGTEGSCRYERRGSQLHWFHYVYHDGTVLPLQPFFERLANEVESIEAKGRELDSACFRDAIEWERRDYFARASEPSNGSRKKRPERFHMQAKTARELGGYYAVCYRTATSFFPGAIAYKTLEQANAAWKEQALPNTVVACCNRLDRCWEMPKYNPLYGEGEMRRDSVPAAPPSPRKEEGDHEPERPV